MEFEWDEEKRQRIIRERRVDVLYAARIFESETLTRVDGRQDYGEERKISLGMVAGECFVVVHTERNAVIRLITAWKGGRDEREQYEKGVAGDHPPDADGR